MDGGRQTRNRKVVSALGPVGLVLGFLIGNMVHGSPSAPACSDFFAPIGNVWTSALRVTVVPLTFSLLFVGIAGTPSTKAVGRWGILSFVTFLAMLVAGALFSLGIGLVYMRSFGPGAISGMATAAKEGAGGVVTFGAWFEHLMPQNAFEAATKGDLLPIAVLAIFAGFAVKGIPGERRQILVSFFTAVLEALMIYVRWVILFLPIGAFALAFVFSAKSGPAIAGATLHFVIYCALVMLVFTALLYGVAVGLGRVPLRKFASAVAPAQAVALGTQSSLASLPTLVECAEAMELPESASSFVLPLSVAVFKQNRTISSVARLLFVAAAFGVTLDAARIFSFVLTVLLLSFATPGIPGGAAGSTFGAYLAAGLPAEGIALFHASEPILEFPGTLLNVTADFVAAVIVSRFSAKAPVESP